jgi:hypothetical protein
LRDPKSSKMFFIDSSEKFVSNEIKIKKYIKRFIRRISYINKTEKFRNSKNIFFFMRVIENNK